MAISNDLLLRTIRQEKVERPPVWIMRQAGRILPQYRSLRGGLSGFKELVTTPELVAEVTVQPVDELNVDAAIIFSDILVIPECMGLDYEMVEKKGPYFPRTIERLEDVERLTSGMEASTKLQYVYEGIRLTKSALNSRIPLIGFAGAPFTLLCYMVEGSGSKTFSKAKRLLYQNPMMAHMLLDKITETTISYLKEKIKFGIDVIQIFDSWAGILDPISYRTFCIPYLRRIIDAIKEDIPTIVFAKGAWFAIEDIASLGSDVIGLDWSVTPAVSRNVLGSNRVVQGNLDPCILYADHSEIKNRTNEMINAFGCNHIVNLGHGVYPDTPLDGVKVFVDTVKAYSY